MRNFRITSLCQRAGISRVTLYKSFPKKKLIIQKSMQMIFNQWISQMDEILRSPGTDLEKLERLMILKESQIALVGNSLIEDLTNPPQMIAPSVQSYHRQAQKQFDTLLNRCRKAGLIDRQLSNEIIFVMMRYMQMFAQDESLMRLVPNRKRRALLAMRLFIHGFTNQSDSSRLSGG